MNIKFSLAILSSLLQFLAYYPYFRDIAKRKTQPHMYSWLIWGVLQLTGTAAIFKGEGGYGAWALLLGGLLCLCVFSLSFKFGTKNIIKFDVLCLIGALFAFIAYIFVSNPLYSIILVTLIDLIAFLPTFRKGFEEPNSETVSTYFLSVLVNILGLIALQYYSATTLLYGLSLVITNGLFCILLIQRRRNLNINL